MTIHIAQITINTPHPSKLAEWWVAALDGSIVADHGEFVFVKTSSVGLGFQYSDQPSGQRIHLDLSADDMAAEVARLTELGASTVAERSVQDFGWTVMADIDGNEFCVSRAHD